MFHDIFLITLMILPLNFDLFFLLMLLPFYLTLLSNVDINGIAHIVFFIVYHRSGTVFSLQLTVMFKGA